MQAHRTLSDDITAEFVCRDRVALSYRMPTYRLPVMGPGPVPSLPDALEVTTAPYPVIYRIMCYCHFHPFIGCNEIIRTDCLPPHRRTKLDI